MTRPVIFISYSHKDEVWKERLVTHLGVARAQGVFDAWEDRQLKGGAAWFQEIVDAIEAGCIGLLLVSENSLSSDFILHTEVPRLLAQRAAGKLRLYPIIIEPCDWEAVAWLKEINLRPRDGRPIGEKNQERTDYQTRLDLRDIATELRQLLAQMQPDAVAAPVAPAPESSYTPVPTLPRPRLFVGRVDLMNEIERRLRNAGAVNLVSLKGTAGVGKSALALEAAYRFGALFPAGRYWVDLRAGDATNALRLLLRALSVAFALESRFDELCALAESALSNRRALLILDSAEAISETERQRLSELCATTIVTSRSAVDPTDDLQVDKLSDEDALQLLAKRGVDVATERADALQLCARLGHLALALEITARRMAIYRPRQTCAAALEELNQSRHLVAAIKLPHSNQREDNIAAAFALSYDKLDPEMRTVFHALGLCAPAGAPLAAIARMLDADEASVRDALLWLAEWSLADFSGARARLHPLLHSYAEMRAGEQPPEVARLIERHVRYFGAEIGGAYQRAVDVGNGTAMDNGLKRADQEIENILLAQTRALAENFSDPRLAIELTEYLARYWWLRDEPQLLNWLNRACLLAQQTGLKLHQANVLGVTGDIQSSRKEMDAALKSYSAALTIHKHEGNKLGQAHVLAAIGNIQSFCKEIAAALASYDAALTLYKQQDDKLGQANVRLSKGRMNKDAAEFEAAISFFEEIGDTYSIARSKEIYGLMLLDAGETERGVQLLQEARAGYAKINYAPGVGDIDQSLAELDE